MPEGIIGPGNIRLMRKSILGVRFKGLLFAFRLLSYILLLVKSCIREGAVGYNITHLPRTANLYGA